MELDELIAQVQDSAVTDEPLDRLSAAMGVKADLDEVADSLIGHFVDQARRAGCSWSEIGAAMGVTKQAAQQRHKSERRGRGDRDRPWRFGQSWTGRARAAVREAERAAAELGHSYVGTEHLLLGLLAVSQGIAGRLLEAGGITREMIVERVLPNDIAPGGRRSRAPMTPKAKLVIQQALANGLRLGHNYIGTEHLLLGVFDVPDGIGGSVLIEAGMTKDQVEADVIEILKKVS